MHNAYVATTESCQPTQAAGLLVFPLNGSTHGVGVPSASRVCANPSTNGSASITVLTAATVPPPPDPPLNAGSTLDVGGLGPVRVGMTLAEATAAAGLPVVTNDDTVECSYAAAVGGPGHVGFMLHAGRIVRVDVWAGGAVKTVSGAGIGDTEAQIQALYGNRLEVTPAKYIVGGHDLALVPEGAGDQNLRLIFETDGHRVTTFRSGQLPEVANVEGCG